MPGGRSPHGAGTPISIKALGPLGNSPRLVTVSGNFFDEPFTSPFQPCGTKPMEKLTISWDRYGRSLETLALKIFESGWEFDHIVCLAKGGLRVGDVLARLFRKPLGVWVAQSYGGEGNRVRGQGQWAQQLSFLGDRLGPQVLLVDDLVDSGISLLQAQERLRQLEPTIQEIRTAVIWYKSDSRCKPDYFLEYLTGNPWIEQPFEIYEQLTWENLKLRQETPEKSP